MLGNTELWHPTTFIPAVTEIFFYVPLALILLVILGRGVYLWYAPPRPVRAKRFDGGKIEVYCTPLWRVQYIKADAIIAFTNQAGFLGSTTTKFIRDKADYRIDDAIRNNAPIPPGACVLVPLTRGPARRLAATNITDEKGLITPHFLAEAMKSASEALTKERIPTPFATFLMRLPGFRRVALRIPQKPVRSVLLSDPTSDWNYFERRVNEEESAHLLLQATLPNLKTLGTVKILVTSSQSASAYDSLLQATHHLSPFPSEPSRAVFNR